jgi:AP-1 complex subunit mu
MSVSAIFILDVKGRVLIYRDYRGDVSTKFADKFMSKLNESEDSGKLSPVLHDEGVTYIYLQHSNVYLLAVTRQNVNATAVMVFLHRLVDVFKHYFEEVEEESIRDNFVTVYELMDEVRGGAWSSTSTSTTVMGVITQLPAAG